MSKNDKIDDDLEEELEKAFKNNELNKNVFKIMKNEDASLELKENRFKKRFKFLE